MKLLIITADFPPTQSGEANHAYYLAKHLHSQGAEVHILTTSIPGRVLEPEAFSVYPIMSDWSWRGLTRLRRFIKQISPDACLLVFLSAMYHDHPMITFLPTIAKNMIPDVRVVTQYEHVDWHASSGFFTRLARRVVMKYYGLRSGSVDYSFGTLLHGSDSVIVLSEAHKKVLEGHYAALSDKCALIPPPPIMALTSESPESARRLVRAELAVAADHFLLMYYGYVYPSKGIETLLRALAISRQRHSCISLVVVGGVLEHPAAPGCNQKSARYIDELMDLARSLGIGESIIWAGPCDSGSDKASRCFFAADACVFPFRSGVHLNNSSVSAAATHGLPILTTRGESTEDVFANHVLLCDPESPDSMSEAICRLVEDSDLRAKLRDGAASLSREWFSWNSVVSKTFETLL